MNRSQGFTLLEVLVAVAILAILAMVAAPSFDGVLQRARIDTSANALRSALSEARSEAAFKRIPVTICVRNANADACNARSNEWQGGWIVFLDHDADGAIDVSQNGPSGCQNPNDDCIVAVGSPLPASMTLTGNTNTFTFTNIGTAANANPLNVRQTSRGCGVGGQRTIVAAATGRVSVMHGDCPAEEEASNG